MCNASKKNPALGLYDIDKGKKYVYKPMKRYH